MKLCRYQSVEQSTSGFLLENDLVLPMAAAVAEAGLNLTVSDNLLDYLPHGKFHHSVRDMEDTLSLMEMSSQCLKVSEVKLLVPIAQPSKILLLAGNYSKHVQESGDRGEERDNTFPYVFMKPLTTLTHPADPIRIPEISPAQIDWELELGVVIGKECFQVSEADALDYVAGYTIVNDISDRDFTPNPNRIERPRDRFFDWLHGKWHDTFCPIGPCILPADEVLDPQQFELELRLNGIVEQHASTSEMVFSVAAIIEFISSYMTLLPGDIISTGTPDGVGKAKGKFLKPGDQIEAEIRQIGVLRNPVA